MSILTKIFIVLMLVCSLTLAVFVVVILNQQDTYKHNLQDAQLKALTAQSDLAAMEAKYENARAALDHLQDSKLTGEQALNTKIISLQNQIKDLDRQVAAAKSDFNTEQASVAALTTANQALTKTQDNLNVELAGLRHDVPILTQQNAELNRRNNELQTALEAAQNAIKRLQEELAEAQQPQPQKSSAAESGAGGTPTLSAVTPINGKVARVDSINGRTYVTLTLGKRDGIQENFRFTLYHDSSYVGDAIVRKVAPDQSVAEVTVVRPGEQVDATDLAISGPTQ